MSNPTAHLLARGAMLALCVVLLPRPAVTHVGAAGVAPHLEIAAARDPSRWMAHLEFLTRNGSWWWTSNADHAAEDGLDAFAMAYRMVPGNLASRGCLWGIRGTAAAGVAWHFFQGWDAGAEAPFFFQTAEAGTVGMGTGWSVDGAAHSFEQVFRAPDGSTSRIAHRSTRVGQDTMLTASRVWEDGGWKPRRSYTWVRRDSTVTPCPTA